MPLKNQKERGEGEAFIHKAIVGSEVIMGRKEPWVMGKSLNPGSWRTPATKCPLEISVQLSTKTFLGQGPEGTRTIK